MPPPKNWAVFPEMVLFVMFTVPESLKIPPPLPELPETVEESMFVVPPFLV